MCVTQSMGKWRKHFNIVGHAHDRVKGKLLFDSQTNENEVLKQFFFCRFVYTCLSFGILSYISGYYLYCIYISDIGVNALGVAS